MNPWLLFAALVAASGKREAPTDRGPFVLKEGHVYRVRVLVHRCSIPITQQLVDAAREQAKRFGISDIKLTIVNGKAVVEATIVAPRDLVFPGGRVPIEQPPISAEVEYLFVRELGPPGV